MTFSRQVLIGLALGLFAGLFFGEAVAPLGMVASGFVKLLQMTVLPYVTLSIISNLGSLNYAQARSLGLRLGAVLALIWVTSLGLVSLFPLVFPPIETASFFSPDQAGPQASFNFLDLYLPSNPFASLANGVVPAVVLFAILVGLAIIGIERKQALLDVLRAGTSAVGRVARGIVRLTPFGIFAIAANAAGTLDVEQFQRIQVYLIAYVAFALLLALWILPGLIASLTPVGAVESLTSCHEALITAFLVGDLFIVLPSLIESCSDLVEKRMGGGDEARALPGSIIPTSFTFPHAGKLLSVSFILFAGWFSDSVVSLTQFPTLALTGFLSFFGSLNVAIPFLLDQFRIPSDTFQLFLATSVVNQRVGALVAAVHTVAVGLLGSAAMAGRIRINRGRLMRFVLETAVLLVVMVAGLRAGFTRFVDTTVDGRSVVNAMMPIASDPVDNASVRSVDDVDPATIPDPAHMLDGIRERGTLRVGLIDDGIPYAYRNDRNQVVGFDVEMARQMAADLNVDIEFVRFAQADLDQVVRQRLIDIVMTGARLTPERAAAFATSEPYLDETLAIVTEDYRRGQFQSWDGIRALGGIEVGVQNLPYYMGTIRRLLPDARLSVLENTPELLDPAAHYAAYVLPAERGSVLTMLNPRFTVVVPEGATVKMPLAYPIAGADPSWIRFVNAWIDMKKREGTVDRLYAHWILGQNAVARRPRWSIARDVLHWLP
jgi:Na+/H+-dicarboxylate symporter/ABC-type amino acid transport substrate-binding protein